MLGLHQGRAGTGRDFGTIPGSGDGWEAMDGALNQEGKHILMIREELSERDFLLGLKQLVMVVVNSCLRYSDPINL
ncbi:hypothetical protein EZV62_006278 [Acer yangbiense]|uniref:Uncharacterized protein n=1 Tax=Acer yangbiense TaxID=1000413 RepID=A0A5C7IPN8_9ROSI|nr:hypothetical protein EZV62_006278 [Acer yangbiense]